MRIRVLGFLALGLAALIAAGTWGLAPVRPAVAGLEDIANGDAQFWLMQDGASRRYLANTVQYRFDQPVDEALVRARLAELVAPYRMFHRNVVEVDGLPYWQPAEPDWRRNFRVLGSDEDLEAVRIQTDAELSRVAPTGGGLPLFRVLLSADRRTLLFAWHHVISDFEGMFNAHARHLFARTDARTRFGYQLSKAAEIRADGAVMSLRQAFAARPLGFQGSAFEVTRHVLPVRDVELAELSRAAGLSMSDVLSLVALRAVTRYHAADGDARVAPIRPLLSPLSLREDSTTIDEGNRRAVKLFPLVFPLEPVAETLERVRRQPAAATSYDQAGRMLRFARRFGFLEEPARRMGMPDYISNCFPLADDALAIGDAKVIRHDLRVPMVPYERAKFAWSNYDGEVQLFLHTDPLTVDAARLRLVFQAASEEVLALLAAARAPVTGA